MDPDLIDTCITDPPYGLKFMGKKWDYEIPTIELFAQIIRVLKPGAMLLCFGGTRTWHRIAVNIEDAGFIIKDNFAWIYGSGFPKSRNISKAIDKAEGAEREVIGQRNAHRDNSVRKPKIYKGIGGEGKQGLANKKCGGLTDITAPATDSAKLWDGWGTALKPAFEPIIIAMKPLQGTYVENALKYGVAGFNIDEGAIGIHEEDNIFAKNPHTITKGGGITSVGLNANTYKVPKGRWPANVIHDGSEEVVRGFPSPHGAGAKRKEDLIGKRTGNLYGKYANNIIKVDNCYGDSGSASRFFYTAKASSYERNAGLYGMKKKRKSHMQTNNGTGKRSMKEGFPDTYQQNDHPTVKPLSLMRYLVRLTKTPTGGIILDPFMGSGTTGIAAKLEGRDFIGIEIDVEYYEMAQRRVEYAVYEPELFTR